jgi:hypothetical protein
MAPALRMTRSIKEKLPIFLFSFLFFFFNLFFFFLRCDLSEKGPRHKCAPTAVFYFRQPTPERAAANSATNLKVTAL